MPRFPRLAATMLALPATALALAGCSTAAVERPAPIVHYGCIDDSRQCIDQRQAQLRGLLADRSRTWVRDPASAGSYATGVRLYAFKTEKQRLNCDELAAGRREASAGPVILRGPAGQGLPPATVARGVIFAEEVGKELTREAQRRCRV